LKEIIISFYRAPKAPVARKQQGPKRRLQPGVQHQEHQEEDADTIRPLDSPAASPSRSPSPPPAPTQKSKGKGKDVGKGKAARTKKVATPPPSPSHELEYRSDDGDDDEEDAYRPSDEDGDSDSEGMDAEEEVEAEHRRRRGEPIDPGTPTGKRQQNNWTLPDPIEKRAIPYLEVHEVLWDKAHKDYANKDVVRDTWAEFSVAMGGAYSAKHLKKWATNLRTQVGRLKKRRLGVSGQAPERWSTRSKFLWNNTQFLLETIQQRSYEVSIFKSKWVISKQAVT
jgi:hypothetical protein